LLRKQRKTLGGYFFAAPCTHGATDRTPNLLISSNVHYVQLGGDNKMIVSFSSPENVDDIGFSYCTNSSCSVFTRESSYCFQRVLAIAILSVCPSVTRVYQSKKVQARITKSSPSAAWKTLVSGTVKLLHKFERGHPERGR